MAETLSPEHIEKMAFVLVKMIELDEFRPGYMAAFLDCLEQGREDEALLLSLQVKAEYQAMKEAANG